MATGIPAFQKKTHAETTAAILRDEPERLGAKTLQAPAPFIWIVERCLAKDPKQRYASTRDLARDLAAVRDRLADMPARESEPRRNNLPVQRTAFIGRERETADLRQMCIRDRCYTGPIKKAEKIFKPIRSFKAPALDMVGPIPYPVLQSMHDGLYPPGQQWYWKADFVRTLPNEAIAVHVKYSANLPSMQSTMHLYPINGAAGRIKNSATPWGCLLYTSRCV